MTPSSAAAIAATPPATARIANDPIVPPRPRRRRSRWPKRYVDRTVQLHQLQADLACLDGVIRQFDPDYPLEAIRPRYRRQATAAEVGSLSRAVLDTLRRAGEPLSVPEIAKRIIAERVLDQGDRALYRNMSKRVSMALRYQRTNEMVEEKIQQQARTATWQIVA
ncbi:MAG: hypothetical protein KGM47_12715, partial [Acidobacteriota bacterium]|nr:hypothetical protein [Acidobacteriota bacterium]